MKRLLASICLLASIMLTGCAKPTHYDYTAFKESRPHSILVLPPVNKSPDINATHSFLSQTTKPLSEAGYYVFPVAVVEETFKQNGMTSPEDMRTVSTGKLREIFGADAVMYIDVTDYGTKYMVVDSETRVTASARLVDLRNGKLLWSGSVSNSDNANTNSNNGILTMLVVAAVHQISNNISDKSYTIAGYTSNELLSPHNPYAQGKTYTQPGVISTGILYGPRSPDYGKDKS
ncbi:MAG: DUF799 domain-containing protein [Rouxiella aceris]|uniref:DUF799 domain-containing protein n=1 Tax=Rouxiella aceris TaxID=2703884 RepID=UPI0028516D0C|nr:DUF799 domain-containing protein [Rouxiella aceris]MDR3432209.1 DUF799 domain-containing protein [Rouxiella aceris]